jgi:hypothetical protein
MWMANAHSIWSAFTDKAFTPKRHKGEPATEAAAFCVETLKSVDPKVPASAVMNEMEKRLQR